MMKKRLGALLLCLLLVFSLSSGALAAEGDNVIELSTAEDLLQLGLRPDASFVLTRDIDMGGLDWEPVAFTGKLDGNGHVLYNLKVNRTGGVRADTVDGNNKVYDSVFAGLFSTLINARVENLTLRGVDIQIRSGEHCFVGGITGYIKNSEIANCSILDARISLVATCQPEPVNPRTSCNAGAGGIAGFGSGAIRNCTAETVLVFDDQFAANLKVEEFMGGVLSCGDATITGCSVTVDGYDACRGYAHNGGLVGMFYLYDKSEALGTITGCSVDGSITFFEDNTDRRAYCQPFVGELLTWTNMSECTQTFTRNELFDYTAKLSPEKCETPSYTETRQEADCDHWGYTVHSCTVCGHTWRDEFAAPAHVPGEWTVTQAATYETAGRRELTCTLCGQVIAEETIAPHVAGEWVTVQEAGVGRDGLRRLYCADCGEVLEEEIIPGKKGIQSIVLDQTMVNLYYKDELKIGAEIYPADAANTVVYWTSSNERAVIVDTNGTVHAVGRGTATVTCTSADGQASSQCQVRVDYTLKQWVTMVLLFGWLWY